MRFQTRFSFLALAVAATATAHAARVRFLVVDPLTGAPVDASVTLTQEGTQSRSFLTNLMSPGLTASLDPFSSDALFEPGLEPTDTVRIPLGSTVTLQQRDVPVKEIVIHVTAKRILISKAPAAASSTTRDHDQLQKFTGGGGNDSRNLTKGQSGVAEDSAGQQHVRGEHAEVAYVVDGVPLPDTLSGRQGSIVVPSTIQTLEMITGGFAPEFGGQTAAVLNIGTLPRANKASADSSFSSGSFGSSSEEITVSGPAGPKLGYVLDLGTDRTKLGTEAPQPNSQDSHNLQTTSDYFAKFRLLANTRDTFTLTFSHNPGQNQIPNRTGLPDSFASVGEGYGFFGLRNKNGIRSDVNADNSGLLGAAPMVLQSQQDAGQRIDQSEVDEFSVLSYDRKVNSHDTANLAVTFLHSGQEVTNNNPAVDATNLPVDSSIEYNPQAHRNVHHVQATGNYAAVRGEHHVKLGFLIDSQSGTESYNITPGSQLALDELAAVAPSMAPAGSASTTLDINGNPVYTATSKTSPTLKVNRTGTYKAAYLQDTWQMGSRFLANYGVRADWFNQNQNLGQPDVHAFEVSPRLNFQYKLDKHTDLHWAYNHLFNTPPLAQGAVVGQAIQPEILDQYDIGISHVVKPGQTVSLAYFYKDIKNQVDTGLMIPGSQIGLYSAVNLAKGGVHGLEFSYDISAPKGLGWDSYLNYSLMAAKPNGKDNTGANVPDFNDHDQRDTVGFGLAYTWKGGATIATTVDYGSGLASSIVSGNQRTPRTDVGLHLSTGDRFFRGHGGIGLDVANLFDRRDVINFQSGFSGTRFQMARRITLQGTYKF